KHHPSAVRQLSKKRRIRALQLYRDSRRIDHFHAIDRGDFASAIGIRQRPGAIKIELNGGGIKRFTVMEFNARPNIEGKGLPIVAESPGRGEAWNKLKVWSRIDEFIAKRGEYDAPDIGTSAVRIEHIGIVLQAYPQGDRLCNGCSGCENTRHSQQCNLR